MTTGITVRQCNPTDPELAAFVARRRSEGAAGLGHDPRWFQVLEDALGHRPKPLLARVAGRDVCGYLPLALVSTRLFGRFLVSLPYLDQVGVVADSAVGKRHLLDRAVAVADREVVDYLELRHGQDAVPHGPIGSERTDKDRMLMDLPKSGDGLWKAIGSKPRNLVRKGEKSNLRVQWGQLNLVNDFYSVFAHNMRDLGTPVYSRRLFQAILATFQDEAEIAVAYHEQIPVAAALILHDELAGLTLNPSAGSLRKYRFTNANCWLYYQLLLRAVERGNTVFDFGRSSRDSGPWHFKAQWGARPVATRWQYYVRNGNMNAARPDNPKYRRRIETWQKLPVWVTRYIGPSVSKGIP